MAETSYTPDEVEAAHSLLELHYGSSNHPNPTQAASNPTLTVASSNNSQRARNQVNPIAGGNDLVDSAAPVRYHEARASRSVGQMHAGNSNLVFVYPVVTASTTPSSSQIVSTSANTNQNQVLPVFLEQAVSQWVQLPSIAQVTNEQAPSMRHLPSPIRAAPPNTNRDSTHRDGSSALQEFLLRQQRIAGIAPQDMIRMPRQQNYQQQSISNQGHTPSVIQISRDGNVSVPRIPPATFEPSLPVTPIIPSDPTNHAIGRRTVSPDLSGIPGNQRSRPLNGITRHHAILADEENIYPFPSIRQNPSQAVNGITSEQGYSLCSTTINSGNVYSQNSSRGLENNQCYNGNRSDSQYAAQASSTSQTQSQIMETTDKASIEDKGQQQGTENQREFVDFEFASSLASDPRLEIRVLQFLSIKDIYKMCAVSRRFDQFAKDNSNLIASAMSKKVHPYTYKIFEHACYKRCHVLDRSPQGISPKPTLIWLNLLCSRANIVQEITYLFSKRGFQLIPRCEIVLSKIWFLMDIPDNTRRIWTITNRNLWTDSDIFHGIFLLAQIESCFTGHGTGASPQGLRRLLMAQKNLTMLRDALKSTDLVSHYQVMKSFIRWKYKVRPHERFMNLFGVPYGEVGSLQYEYYHNVNSTKLQRPDELILRECTARQLDIFKMYCGIYVQTKHTDPRLARKFGIEHNYNFIGEIRKNLAQTATVDDHVRAVLIDEN